MYRVRYLLLFLGPLFWTLLALSCSSTPSATTPNMPDVGDINLQIALILRSKQAPAAQLKSALPDQKQFLNTASSNQKIVVGDMLNRFREIYNQLCQMDAEQNRLALEFWHQSIDRQKNNWQHTQGRYQHQLDLLLDEHDIRINQGMQTARQAIRQLESKRMSAIYTWWSNQLIWLAENNISIENKEACSQKPAWESQNLPELNFEALYLARFHFWTSIPLIKRNIILEKLE